MTKDETREWVADLLSAFAGQENTLTIPRAYIDVTGNIEDALLLSQIVYWTDRTKMDDGWFAKSYVEWQDEIALSKYQVMSATKRLHAAGVETMVKKFNGAPTVHYRLRKSEFAQWIVKKLDERKSRNLTNDSEETSQSSTETTPEITTEKKTRKRASGEKTFTYPEFVRDWRKPHMERFISEHGTELQTIMECDGYSITDLSQCGNAEQKRLVDVVRQLEADGIAHTDYQNLLAFCRRSWSKAPISVMPQNVAKWREWKPNVTPLNSNAPAGLAALSYDEIMATYAQPDWNPDEFKDYGI